MRQCFQDVLDFHRKFDKHIEPLPNAAIDMDESYFRLSLISEEFDELELARKNDDIVQMADACADLIYVVTGFAIAHGIDLRPVWNEVHRSNMAKEGGGKDANGKVRKPPGWTPPDVAGVLGRQDSLIDHVPMETGYYWAKLKASSGDATYEPTFFLRIENMHTVETECRRFGGEGAWDVAEFVWGPKIEGRAGANLRGYKFVVTEPGLYWGIMPHLSHASEVVRVFRELGELRVETMEQDFYPLDRFVFWGPVPPMATEEQEPPCSS